MSEKQTVWIVMGKVQYEGDYVLSVHATEAGANAFVEADRARPNKPLTEDFDTYAVVEHEVKTP